MILTKIPTVWIFLSETLQRWTQESMNHIIYRVKPTLLSSSHKKMRHYHERYIILNQQFLLPRLQPGESREIQIFALLHAVRWKKHKGGAWERKNSAAKNMHINTRRLADVAVENSVALIVSACTMAMSVVLLEICILGTFIVICRCSRFTIIYLIPLYRLCGCLPRDCPAQLLRESSQDH